MSKKTFCIILAIISIVVFSNISAMASSNDENSDNLNSNIETYASNSQTYSFKSGVAYTDKINLGANPTITFSVTGNPNLYFELTVVTPIGTTVVFDKVRGNGTTTQKRVTSIISGDFIFTIRPYDGTSYGQTVTAVLKGTW